MAGTVYEANGRQAKGATVVLLTDTLEYVGETTTNKGGKYSFDHVVPGAYVLYADNGVSMTIPKECRVDPGQTTRVDFFAEDWLLQ